MLAGVTRRLLRDLSLQQIRHVPVVRVRTAGPVVRRIYRSLEGEFGILAPPVALHAASPDVLVAVWLMVRDGLLTPGHSDRLSRETVAAAVSEANSCPFCVTVHGAMRQSLLAGTPAVPEHAAALRDLAGWATGPGGGADAGPRTPAQAAELVAVAVLMQYLNRVVNVFLGAAPLPPGAPVAVLPVVSRVLIGVQRSAQRRVRGPGTDLDLLPDARLAADMSWAAASPPVAAAFARAAAALDRAGERAVPAPVRALVHTRLDGWDGAPPPLSRRWVEDEVAVLAPRHRPLARFVLLVALASYQIDDDLLAGLPTGADRAEVLEAAAWSAMAAARRIGARLPVPAVA